VRYAGGVVGIGKEDLSLGTDHPCLNSATFAAIHGAVDALKTLNFMRNLPQYCGSASVGPSKTTRSS
jgi:hypothetical protein